MQVSDLSVLDIGSELVVVFIARSIVFCLDTLLSSISAVVNDVKDWLLSNNPKGYF